MKFHVLTLFPKMVDSLCADSILGRATQAGLIEVNTVNIRDYTEDKHNKVDDYTYGGGAGMLMQAQPVYDAWRSVTDGKKLRTVYVTPQGRVFDSKMAKSLAQDEEIVLLCGHYEGIDERVLEEVVTDYISIGDYVLTGGELAVGVIIDAVSRFVPGVLGNDESATTESFHNDLLEYPQYSRPEVWHGKSVPKVLMSGDHIKIRDYRLEQSIIRTKERRPDLLRKYQSRIDVADKLDRDKKSRRDNIHISQPLREGAAKIIIDNGDFLVTYIEEGGICSFVVKNSDFNPWSISPLAAWIIRSTKKIYINRDSATDILQGFGYDITLYSRSIMKQYVYTAKVSLSTAGLEEADLSSSSYGLEGNGALIIEDVPDMSIDTLLSLEVELINSELREGKTPYFQFPLDSRLNDIQETVGTYAANTLLYVYSK